MPKKIHKGQILLLMALAQFMVVLDISIVNVALPSIREALNFSEANLQWVVTAYTLAFGGFLLLGGRAADLFGRKRLFLGGVAAFTVASLLAGISQSSEVLIFCRALQGLSAAFMSPAALSIIINTFKEGKERNKALGVWGGVAAGGAAAGLLFGGVLTEYLGWEWNFFVNVPIGLVLFYFVYKVVPESKAELRHRHLDLLGAVLVTTGLMSLVYGLVKAPEYGWTSDKSLMFFGASFILLALFIFNELKSKQPLVPLDIFKLRNLRGANLVQMPVTASMFSMFFFLTLYVQTILGFSPVKTGLAFLPITIVIGISSAIVSQLVGKVGYKPPMVVAPLFLAAGLLYFSHMPVNGTYWGDVFPGLMLMALGLGFLFVSVTIAATSGVPKDKSGLASGILNTSQQIGGSLGLAILTGIFAAENTRALKSGSDFATAQVAGFDDAFFIGACFALAASVIALVAIKHVRGEPASSEAVHLG
ncbi:MAG TPA: MFS transporter [Patescibacteria group bacterium]|nr:MFS transporter [Patescibacteria group bacterium]